MENINDLINIYLKFNTKEDPQGIYLLGAFESRRTYVSLDLDESMPRIYHMNTENPKKIISALAQLELEVKDSRAKRCLFKTNYKDNMQKIEVYHNGSYVPENALEETNSFLEKIAKGEVKWNQWRHGNRIAAQKLFDLNGEINLENLNEEEFKVRTTIKIPYKSRDK